MKKKLLTLAVVTAGVAGCTVYYKKNSQQNRKIRQRETFDNQSLQATTENNETKITEIKTEDVVPVEEVLEAETEEKAPSEEPVKTAEVTQEKPTETLKNDDFNLTGSYHWTFHLGFIKQESIHVFAKDYIDYKMRGKAHSTDYRIEKVSYDDTDKKWIGKSEDGTVYVLFFKDITDESITIYKHKCANGMEEAIAFARPADDETKDHGWNIYAHEATDEKEDVLPFAGTYQNEEQQLKININDKQVTYQDKTYTKLSHHTGEKRWVGKLDDELLVVFYQTNTQDADNYQELLLAIETFDDGEPAYKAKHDEQTFISFIKKPVAKAIHVQVIRSS
ncbi:MAG: hypothetical protein KGV51_01760 [Moraxellaceae bacterium]|nr:hypothetical protein [Moraxellaceae bacterium]